MDSWDWPLSPNQIRRFIEQAGAASPVWIERSLEKADGSQLETKNNLPSAAVIYVKWYPLGAPPLGVNEATAAVWICRVPRKDVTEIRKELKEEAVPSLANWLAGLRPSPTRRCVRDSRPRVAGAAGANPLTGPVAPSGSC